MSAAFTYSVFSDTLNIKVQERNFRVTYFVVSHVESSSPAVPNPQILAVFHVYGLISTMFD